MLQYKTSPILFILSNFVFCANDSICIPPELYSGSEVFEMTVRSKVKAANQIRIPSVIYTLDVAHFSSGQTLLGEIIDGICMRHNEFEHLLNGDIVFKKEGNITD